MADHDKVANLEEIPNDETFVKKLEAATKNHQKICVDFTATWCAPCRAIAPVFVKLAKEHPDIMFWKTDIDKCKGVAMRLGVRSIPTFHCYVGDTLVRHHQGANEAALTGAVIALAEKTKEELIASAEENPDGDKASTNEDLNEGDLARFVDMTKSECMNDHTDHPFGNIWNNEEGKYLLSDTDEQLLFTIAFKCVVSIKSIKFIAPNDGTGPKRVRLFVNRLNPGFDQAEEDKAVQEFDLKPEDLNATTNAVKLDFVKFVNIHSITVFVKSNQGGQDNTKINQIILWGKKVA